MADKYANSGLFGAERSLFAAGAKHRQQGRGRGAARRRHRTGDVGSRSCHRGHGPVVLPVRGPEGEEEQGPRRHGHELRRPRVPGTAAGGGKRDCRARESRRRGCRLPRRARRASARANRRRARARELRDARARELGTAGQAPPNICNLGRSGAGVQLELSRRLPGTPEPPGRRVARRDGSRAAKHPGSGQPGGVKIQGASPTNRPARTRSRVGPLAHEMSPSSGEVSVDGLGRCSDLRRRDERHDPAHIPA